MGVVVDMKGRRVDQGEVSLSLEYTAKVDGVDVIGVISELAELAEERGMKLWIVEEAEQA